MYARTIRLLFACLLAPCAGTAQSAPADTAEVNRAIDSLLQVSKSRIQVGQYDQALEVNAEAARLAAAYLGEESAAYAHCNYDRGVLYSVNGKYEEAIASFSISKRISEKVSGKNIDYAVSTDKLGIIYGMLGDYDLAESLCLEAKFILEKFQNTRPVEYAANLHSTATLYYMMGLYERAEPLYLKALAVREQVLTKLHSDYAASLNNLAGLYYDLGHFDKVEAFCLEAKFILEQTQGKENPVYATVVHNLAIFYYEIGRYKESEIFHIEAKNLREKLFSKQNPAYAQSTHNMALLYHKMGRYEESEQLALEAIDLRKKVLPEGHPDYASSVDNLALLYMDLGRYEAVIPLLLEAKDIRERSLGITHPDFVISLNGIAGYYTATKQYPQAESYYLEAKILQEETFGIQQSQYVSSLKHLSALYELQSRYAASDSLLLKLYPLKQSFLTKGITHLSQRELAAYAGAFQSDGDELASYAAIRMAQGGSVSILPALHYDHQLFQKGFLLGAAARLNALAAATPESEETLQRLKGHRRRLAAEYAKPSAERQNVPELETRADSLEKVLTRTVAGFGAALRQVQWQEVQAQLQPGEAAVEFIHFRYYDPQARATDSTLYAALVLLPGNAAPRFVPLCEARQIGAVLKKAGSDQLRFQNIYNALDGSSPLYPLLWQPMEAHLHGVHTVYYAPAGIVHRLNLGAIQPTKRETLSDRYRLAALGSTRQLVIPATASPAGNTAAVFGGIRYEMDSTQIAAVNSAFADTTAALATRGASAFAYTDSTLRGGDWKFLPATETEAKNISTLLRKHGFQTDTRLGFEATEESVQHVGSGKSPSPRVLHIATHGFFFPDPNSKSDGPSFTIADDPMIRSGLILAGAEHGWKTGKPLRPDMEDGVLTAYEISRMNLRNTELVVLSACKTGLGDIQGNEGVYGLQRAFKIAGARYLLMSLWEAPDKETKEFMESFYTHWLDQGMSIPEAYRAAQAQMRGRYANPYFWAGFVLVE